jgi:hypothetical protein
VEQCRELAHRHNVIVEVRHVFTDRDHEGVWPPTCWAAPESTEVRPALSALIEAVETGLVKCILVHRLERLACSSALLTQLRELLDARDARIVVAADAAALAADPVERFALSILQPRVVCDDAVGRQRKAALRSEKHEEISRLQDKILRLEAEIAELG